MAEKKTIMIVDDEEDIRNTAKAILEKEGYEVFTAANGDECLKKLSYIKIDLILMDIMMPGTPVKDIVKKIINNRKDTKIAYFSIVSTKEAEREDLLITKDIEFIQKPFSITGLAKDVKRILKKK